MHTLPVRSWQLVLSKLICGAVTWVISGIMAFVAPLLLMDWSFLMEVRVLRDMIQAMFRDTDTLFLLLEFCLLTASVIVQFIATIYLAMSIGHLVARHHKLVSI